MIRFIFLASALLAATLLLLGGCAPMIRVQDAPKKRAIPVPDSLPIALERVEMIIPDGTRIGGHAPNPNRSYRLVHYWGDTFEVDPAEFNFPLRDELSSHGYRFATAPGAPWRLKPTVTRLVYNLFGDDPRVGWTEAEIEVHWTVTGPQTFTVVTTGSAMTRPHSLSSVFDAFRAALRNLLSQPEISAALSPVDLRPAPRAAIPQAPTRPALVPASPVPGATLIRRPPVSAAPLDDETLKTRTRSGVVTVLAGDGWSSGVVLTTEGLIVTTASVVESQRQITIVTAGGVQRPGRVLKVDETLGLALVRGHGSGYVPLRLTSVAMGKGTPVVALGTPYHPALSHAVSRGRSVGASGQRITTDARISEGNAGGPVVDLRGRVVGVIEWTSPPGTQSAPASAIEAGAVLRALGLAYQD
jgi:S1-C subfamily serine protease